MGALLDGHNLITSGGLENCRGRCGCGKWHPKRMMFRDVLWHYYEHLYANGLERPS